MSTSADQVVVADGDDWTLPDWVRPAADSGFFSEDAAEADDVAVRSVDVSWRQVAPTPDGPLDLTASGEAQGLTFEPLGAQLDEPGPYWLRLFATGLDWAPEWVVERCGVGSVGTDYDGQEHLPIWDDCVWGALRDTWERLLVDQGVLADPEFRFAYVPGGFTWAEFDFDLVSEAVDSGDLTEEVFLGWFDTMLDDLAAIAGDRVGRLVYTGEDYPFGPFGEADDLLATRAVERGFGVRTGITELSNFHLSETPAYGSTVQPDGHLASDPPPDTTGNGRVVATENECYDDCGYRAQDPDYAVVMSNLKALQLGVTWLYVVPGPSRFAALPEHWDWVRLSLGRSPADSPDAWAALREAEDTYWTDEDGPFGPGGRTWAGKPFVRNLERFLVQRDVAPRAVPVRSEADVHRAELEPDNGTAYEGLRTDVAAGSDSVALDLADDFATGPTDVLVKVTFLDSTGAGFRVTSAAGASPVVERTGTGRWRTATVRLDGVTAGGALEGGTDLWLTLEDGATADLDVRFVRVVRLDAP